MKNGIRGDVTVEREFKHYITYNHMKENKPCLAVVELEEEVGVVDLEKGSCLGGIAFVVSKTGRRFPKKANMVVCETLYDPLDLLAAAADSLDAEMKILPVRVSLRRILSTRRGDQYNKELSLSTFVTHVPASWDAILTAMIIRHILSGRHRRREDKNNAVIQLTYLQGLRFKTIADMPAKFYGTCVSDLKVIVGKVE